MRHDIRLKHAFSEIIQRKRVVISKSSREGEEDDDTDDHQNGQAEQHAECPEQSCRHRPCRDTDEARHRFSRHGHIGILFQIIPLYEEYDQRRDDKKDRQGRAHGKIPRAGDLRVGLRRQHMIIAADQHRIAEICQRVNSDQQEGAGKARCRKAKCHRAEKVPAASPQILRRKLQIRTDAFQYAGDRDIRQRKEGDGLRDPKPEGPIEIHLEMQELPGDKTAAAKQHDKSQTCHDRRRHSRQERHHLKETLAGHIRIVDAVSKQKAKDDRRCSRDQRREDGISKNLNEFFPRDRSHPVSRGRHQKDLGKWIDDKYSKQQKHCQYADQKGRLPEQYLQLRPQAGMLMSGCFFVHRLLLGSIRKTPPPEAEVSFPVLCRIIQRRRYRSSSACQRRL